MRKYKKGSTRVFLKEPYPQNLLLTLFDGLDNGEILVITPDVIGGLQYAISTLKPREQEFIKKRYVERKTLANIGKEFGIGAESAGRINYYACRKLRHPTRFYFVRCGLIGAVERMWNDCADTSGNPSCQKLNDVNKEGMQTKECVATNTEIMNWFITFLEANTDDFETVQQEYKECIEKFKAEYSKTYPFINQLDAAINEQFITEIIFSFNLGISDNKKHFENPMEYDFLKYDYEVFLQEKKAHSLPEYSANTAHINKFFSALSYDLQDALGPTSEYQAFIETYCPKLAHYFGFIYGNTYYKKTIPNYMPDDNYTKAYRERLEKYLQLNLSDIEKQFKI